MKKLLKFVMCCDAAEVAELAVVLPILFTMIFAIFSFGRAYNIYSTITRAAQAGARVATAPLCASCGLNSCTFNGNSVSTAFPCDSTITQTVNDALTASRLDTTRVSQVTPSSTTGCPSGTPSQCTQPSLPSGGTISVCRNVAVNTNANSGLQACGTIVSFQYSYQFLPVPFVKLNTIDIPASAQVRMEF
jgi:hypothetical protein